MDKDQLIKYVPFNRQTAHAVRQAKYKYRSCKLKISKDLDTLISFMNNYEKVMNGLNLTGSERDLDA